MAGRWLMGVACVGMVFGGASRASADEPLVTNVGTEAPTLARPSLLPPGQRLQLSWPIQPLSFSFQGSEQGNSATGPLQLFRTEATWLRLGRLSLLTTSAAELAPELDCWVSCRPFLERSIAVEGRLHLFSTRAVPEVHAFAGYEARWTGTASPNPILATGRGGLWRMGFAGLLDL